MLGVRGGTSALQVRSSAALSLMLLKHHAGGAVPTLAKYISHSDVEVREVAALALGKCARAARGTWAGFPGKWWV